MPPSSTDKSVLALAATPVSAESEWQDIPKKSLRGRIKTIIWDSLDRTPEERRLISKIDFFILTWAGLSYFSKNLNSGNICEF